MLASFQVHDAEKAKELLDSVEKSIEEIKAFISGGTGQPQILQQKNYRNLLKSFVC